MKVRIMKGLKRDVKVCCVMKEVIEESWLLGMSSVSVMNQINNDDDSLFRKFVQWGSTLDMAKFKASDSLGNQLKLSSKREYMIKAQGMSKNQ